MSRIRVIAALIAACTTVSIITITPAQAASSSPGLYGAQDPTYDGVFRQSLAILGLKAAGVQPSSTASTWLLQAQCADGSFQEFRAAGAPCDRVDPENFSGPDTNATAAAAAALRALGSTVGTAASNRALTWLTAQQNADGGWGFSPGTASDANSTGLVLAALRQQQRFSPVIRRGIDSLSARTAACGGPDGGGLPFQPGAKVDGSASAQGLLGLTGFLPLRALRPLAADPTCAKGPAQRVGSHLAATLAADGVLTSAMGGGADYTNTANAVLGLTALGRGKVAVQRAMQTLRMHARDYAMKDGAPVPAALGLLILSARATGADPRSFGGVDLVRTLQGSEQR